MLAPLVYDHGIMQRTWKLYYGLDCFCARARSRVKNYDGNGLMARMRCRNRSACIRCRDDRVHSLGKCPFGNLLALSETDGIFAMYLVDTTATDTIMRVVLQEILPGESH